MFPNPPQLLNQLKNLDPFLLQLLHDGGLARGWRGSLPRGIRRRCLRLSAKRLNFVAQPGNRMPLEDDRNEQTYPACYGEPTPCRTVPGDTWIVHKHKDSSAAESRLSDMHPTK